jgi:hypothetical protein
MALQSEAGKRRKPAAEIRPAETAPSWIEGSAFARKRYDQAYEERAEHINSTA